MRFSDFRRRLHLNSFRQTLIQSAKNGWWGDSRSPVAGGGQLRSSFGSLVFTLDDVDNTARSWRKYVHTAYISILRASVFQLKGNFQIDSLCLFTPCVYLYLDCVAVELTAGDGVLNRNIRISPTVVLSYLLVVKQNWSILTLNKFILEINLRELNIWKLLCSYNDFITLSVFPTGLISFKSSKDESLNGVSICIMKEMCFEQCNYSSADYFHISLWTQISTVLDSSFGLSLAIPMFPILTAFGPSFH